MHAVTVDSDKIDQDLAGTLYDLFNTYYHDTSPERFQADLGSKDRVVLVRDESGQVVGFSTIAVFETGRNGAHARVVFSGDTIIDQAHWGSQVFAFEWLREIGRIKAEAPDLPLYWLLISKGYRTYRYLETFSHIFTPDWRGKVHPELDAIRNAVAGDLFGDAFDPASGVLSWPEPRGRLAPRMAELAERERARPDVRFFLERNPDYAEGDELVCLCPLEEENMKPLTRRVFRQGLTPCLAGTP